MTCSIGVLWDKEVDWEGQTPFGNRSDETYRYLSSLADSRDVKLLLGNYNWYSQGSMDKAWVYNGGWNRHEDLEVEGVFDKFLYNKKTFELKKRINSEVGIINNPELERICKDKFLTYQKFSNWMPETRKASESAVANMLRKHGKVVLKPRFAYGGEGIHILEEKRLPDIELEEYIVQEFVDSSEGINDLVEGVHDLRAIIAGGEVKGSYIRHNSGGEISNVSQGGEKKPLKVEEFPNKAEKIVKNVKRDLGFSDISIYSVDLFFNSEGRPYIIELNSKPGLTVYDEETKKRIKPVMTELIKSFKVLANERP